MLTLLQIVLAPVVLISACGLLCLALYNRFSNIISRARAFHREMFDCQTQLTKLGNPESDLAAQLTDRIAILSGQTAQILARAAKIRAALFCLLLTIVCMLACSLLLAAPVPLVDPAQIANGSAFNTPGTLHTIVMLAGAVFVVGIVLMIAAMIFAVLELRTALDPVAIEHEEITEPESSL